MLESSTYDDGLWGMVVFNVLLFGAFAVGFLRPRGRVDGPTLVTLLMWSVLVWAYHRLAMREEREMVDRFGDAHEAYRRLVPAYVPRRRTSVRGREADDVSTSGEGSWIG